MRPRKELLTDAGCAKRPVSCKKYELIALQEMSFINSLSLPILMIHVDTYFCVGGMLHDKTWSVCCTFWH